MPNSNSMTVMIQLMEKSYQLFDTTELPSQLLLIFAYVAERKEIPMADLMKVTGLAQSSISRNVSKLAQGEPKSPGYGLIEAYEDPYYRRRKLVKITPRGEEFAKALDRSVSRYLKAAA